MLTLLHAEQPKLYGDLAVVSAVGLKTCCLTLFVFYDDVSC